MSYTNLDARVGHWLAYPFMVQMLRGAKAEDVLQLRRAYFSGTLSNNLRASSVRIMRELQQGGVQSHIISARTPPGRAERRDTQINIFC